MCKKLQLLLCVGMLCISFSTFAQTPYNVVMNLYGDPKTQMAFNWFSTVTGGKVEVVQGIATSHSAFNTPLKTVNATITQNANKAVVTELSPNTTYSFRVGKAGAWSNIGIFTTAKANKDPFSFVYFTDTQVADFGVLQTNANAMSANCPNAKFWLHCGDMIWNGNIIGEWNQFFAAQQDLFYRFPFAPAIGNHDAQFDNDNFSRHFNIENFGNTDSQRSTYTYIYGDAQFFAINSELYGDTITYIPALKSWMRAEAAAHRDITWRIVYFHKSAYTGTHLQDSANDVRQWRQTMTPLFDELDIDLVLFGHDHLYQVIGPVKNMQLVQGSVSNVVQGNPQGVINATGKSGGIFNTKEGTLYFCNNHAGTCPFDPWPLAFMPGTYSSDVTYYRDLFTGRLGQNGNPTYSNVAVSSDAIVITTYEVINKSSNLLDEIRLTKYCQPNTQRTVVYDSNQSFTNTVLAIGETLRINNNATVTFTNSTLRFDKNAQIVVEPGSKLIINGGVLTAACEGKMWQGITVLGDRNKTQLALPTQSQGTVELKNNATIEHALCAISAAPANQNQTGGIIKTNGATFRNNWRAIEYGAYDNHNTSGTITDNVGKFTKCTFIIDDNNRFAANMPIFNSHVKMYGVRGIVFEGCFFENKTDIRGYGIYTENAGFKVKNYCADIQSSGIDCACIKTTPSTFINHAFGINSVTIGDPHSIYIDQSKFQDNKSGVVMNAQNNYRLTRCNFLNIEEHGLKSVNSSGYQVEENNFSSTIINNQYSIGIAMFNSGSAENRIYKNDFSNLWRGISVQQINGPELNAASRENLIQGLQFGCNNFTQNQYDLYLLANATIRPHQGSSAAGADNCFSVNPAYSIYSISTQPINYYYNAGNSCHVPINSVGNLSLHYNNVVANPCASTFCTPVGGGPGSGLETKTPTIDSLEAYKLMQEQYDKLLVELEENPKLLQELLVLSDAMRELSDHAISRILQDSILYLDALIQWYGVVRTPIAKYLLAEAYAYEGKFDQSDAILKKIPEQFEYDKPQLEEHGNYMKFHNFKKNMKLSDKNWPKLDEKEITQLQIIAETTEGRSATMAQGVLCFFYDICYEDKEEEEGWTRKDARPCVSTKSSVSTDQNQYYELSVYPNPAQEEVMVNSNNSVIKIVQVEIYDLFGRKALQQTLHQSSGKIGLNELPQGIYVLKVLLNQGDVIVQKVVKQ